MKTQVPQNEEQARRIRAWVEALESGKYRQTFGNLRMLDEYREKTGERIYAYCALGVACRVYEEVTGVNADYTTTSLPYHVSRWYGLTANPAVVNPTTGLYDLEPATVMDLNDGEQLPLKEIGKVVRATYLGGDDGSNGGTNDGE